MRRWTVLSYLTRALTWFAHGKKRFGALMYFPDALSQTSMGPHERVRLGLRCLRLTILILLAVVVDFSGRLTIPICVSPIHRPVIGRFVCCMSEHDGRQFLTVRPPVIDIVRLVNHSLQHRLKILRVRHLETLIEGKSFLTITCIARGHVSWAERNKSLALSSSWRAAGERHVNGALDTSRHKATYNRNKSQIVSQFVHGVVNNTTKRQHAHAATRGGRGVSEPRQKGC